MEIELGKNLLPESRVLSAWRTYIETSQEINTRLDDSLRHATGSDLGEFNLMMALAEAPDHTLTMSALAKHLVFSIPRLSYRVKALCDQGWVEKAPCPNDKRATNVTLTPAGLGRLQQVGATHRAHVRDIFDAALNLAEMEQLAALMAKVGDRL